MKVEDLRAKTDAELEFELANVKKELFETRFKGAVSNDAKTGRIRAMRREVARINTILHERALGVRGATSK